MTGLLDRRKLRPRLGQGLQGRRWQPTASLRGNGLFEIYDDAVIGPEVARERDIGVTRAGDRQRDDPHASAAFRAADGDTEFQTDGAMVNTTGGWREMRLSIFAKRRRGEPVGGAKRWQ